MKRFKLNSIIDIIFANLLLGLTVLLWSRFIFKSLNLALIFSIVFLIVLNLILKFTMHKKETNKKITQKLKSDIESYSLTLLSNTNEENLSFFSLIFSSSKVVKSKNLIITNTSNQNLSCEKTIICPLFLTENLIFETALKQISSARTYNPTKIILLCNSIDAKTKMRLENLNYNIEIYNKDDVYFKILLKYNVYPKIIYTQKSKSKLNLKLLFSISFKRTNAKHFFLSGIFLFISSFFIRNNIYYVIFSSILFFLSFVCLFDNSKSLQ